MCSLNHWTTRETPQAALKSQLGPGLRAAKSVLFCASLCLCFFLWTPFHVCVCICVCVCMTDVLITPTMFRIKCIFIIAPFKIKQKFWKVKECVIGAWGKSKPHPINNKKEEQTSNSVSEKSCFQSGFRVPVSTEPPILVIDGRLLFPSKKLWSALQVGSHSLKP